MDNALREGDLPMKEVDPISISPKLDELYSALNALCAGDPLMKEIATSSIIRKIMDKTLREGDLPMIEVDPISLSRKLDELYAAVDGLCKGDPLMKEIAASIIICKIGDYHAAVDALRERKLLKKEVATGSLTRKVEIYYAALDDSKIEEAISLFAGGATYRRPSQVYKGKDALLIYFSKAWHIGGMHTYQVLAEDTNRRTVVATGKFAGCEASSDPTPVAFTDIWTFNEEQLVSHLKTYLTFGGSRVQGFQWYKDKPMQRVPSPSSQLDGAWTCGDPDHELV